MDNAPVGKMVNKSFKEGERLSYTIDYGFVKAGTLDMIIKEDLVNIRDKNCYHAVASGTTTGMTNWFFPVKDTYQTFIDVNSMVPQRFLRDVREGKYRKTESVEFNQKTNTAVNNGKDTVQMGANFQDILSAYYYSRCLDVSTMKEGDAVPVYAYLDATVNPFRLRYAGKETIVTKAGTFNCLVFKPEVQEGRAFADKEGMTIWISDDLNRIPVMVEAKLAVGAIKMNLSEYSGIANPMVSKVK